MLAAVRPPRPGRRRSGTPIPSTYTAPVTDSTNEPPSPVSMSKPGGAAPRAGAVAPKPRQVQWAVVALLVAAVFAVATAIGVLSQRDWLTTEQGKANVKAVSSAVSSATASAARHRQDVPKAAASASASAASKYPASGAKLDHQVSTQVQGVLISSLLVMAVLGFLALAVYKGRHWSRWGVTGFWILASFTGTGVGLLNAVQGLASNGPVAVRLPTLVAALSMIVAVVLVNLRVSTEYFAANRPAGAPPRRGMFSPRPPQEKPQGRGSVLTSSAASRGEKYVDRQRSKKRANAEAVARGAELARSRAKASKSRRSER